MNDLRNPCKCWAESISLAAAGCLSADEAHEVGQHVATCPACRERFEQLSRLCNSLAAARSPADGVGETIVERVKLAVDDTTIAHNLSKYPLTTWRWIMRSRVSRIAAAVVLVLTITGIALWFHGPAAAPALADFLKPLLEPKGVKYKMTIQVKQPLPGVVQTITSQIMELDGARSRNEMQMMGIGKAVTIMDWRQRKTLTLYPGKKEATVLTYADMPEYRPPKDRNPLAGWRRLLRDAQDNHRKKGIRREPLGERQIDGRQAVGYRIDAGRGIMDLWGDPKTGLPVRVEMTMGMDDSMKSTMSDFEFNVQMDESLFSVDPPADYKVRNETVEKSSPPNEKNLVDMFREFAKLTGGKLPDALNQQTVSWEYWKRANIQSAWENATAMGGGASDQERREFERQMNEDMDRMMARTVTGQMDERHKREFVRHMTKKMVNMSRPRALQQVWDHLALMELKPNEEQKRRIESLILKTVDNTVEAGGKPDEKRNRKMAEEIARIIREITWEHLAPAEWKANEEKRRRFEELVPKITEKKGHEKERQTFEDEFRKALGDDMLRRLRAWEARVVKATRAQAAEQAKAMEARAESAKTKSQDFMDAQRRISRGVAFANELPRSADVHYAGRGVLLGTPDTPIFWYRPKESKKYRVIYADLSVRQSDTPPNAPDSSPTTAPVGQGR